MASISPTFILDGTEKNKSALHANKMAFHVALFSVIGGGMDPLLMADNKEAKTKPVVFEGPANS